MKNKKETLKKNNTLLLFLILAGIVGSMIGVYISQNGFCF